MIRLRIEMEPRGQQRAGRTVRSDATGRPRIVTYTPELTRSAVNRIRAAWAESGSQKVPAGVPFRIVVIATAKRPSSHTKRDGSPSASWAAIPRRPDVDNILKLVLDALQPCCFADDAACSEATVVKMYGAENSVDVTISWN